MSFDFQASTSFAGALSDLSRAQKAAAILVAMGKPAAGRLLKFFKHEELKSLIQGARLLKTIPQSELEKIIAEFEDEFAEGAGLMDSADTMDTIISESLTPEEVNAIMSDDPGLLSGEPQPSVWPLLERLEPEKLGQFLATEHPQTIAFVLSNVEAQCAANVLLALPKPMRGGVVKRMLSVGEIKSEPSRIIENQLRSRLLGEGAAAGSSVGRSRVASLLNEMEKSQLDEVLGDMAKAGAADLEALKASLFSFDDVLVLPQKARLTLFDGLSTELVTMALRGANGELTEAVLSALGARSRRMIESELASDVTPPQAEVMKARRLIASTAIRLSREGLIELPSAQNAA